MGNGAVTGQWFKRLLVKKSEDGQLPASWNQNANWSYVWDPSHIACLDELINLVVRTCDVDPDQVYVTGHSDGGYAALRLALELPHAFAAAAPVSPYWEDSHIADLAREFPQDLPLWVFHASNDTICLPDPMRDLVQQLRHLREAQCPEDVSRVAEVRCWCREEHVSITGHCADRPAYAASDEMYRWFLQHRRNSEGENSAQELCADPRTAH